MTRISIQSVAGAAYPGNDPRNFLTHAQDVDTGAALCGRVQADNLLQDGSEGAEPTCKTCARKLAKLTYSIVEA